MEFVSSTPCMTDMKTTNGQVYRSKNYLMTNFPAVQSTKGPKHSPPGCLGKRFLGIITPLPLKNVDSLPLVIFVCLSSTYLKSKRRRLRK